MKNILLFLLLFYCNSFELIGLHSDNNKDNNKNFFSTKSLSFFNIISQTTAQSINREHQESICNKLKFSDFNGDGQINGADYSMLYLVAMKDQNTIETIHKNPELFALMDLSLDVLNREIAQENNEKNNYQAVINEQDVVIFYNYLTNQIPYCPFKKS
jgi:hypothetical protein